MSVKEGFLHVPLIYFLSTFFIQASNPECIRRSLVQLSIFLCHRFPRVRKYTADKFYEALLTFADKQIVPGFEILFFDLTPQNPVANTPSL